MGRAGFRRSKKDKQWAVIGGMFLIIFYVLTEFPIVFYSLAIIGIVALVIFILLKIKNSKFKAYDISYVDKMNPTEFEQYVCSLYKNKGFKDSWCTKKSGDFGADVIVEMGYCRMAIQAKRYNPNNTVGVKALYEVLGGKSYYKASKAAVVTTSYFTDSAQKLAKSSNIELIDRTKLIKMIKEGSTGH